MSEREKIIGTRLRAFRELLQIPRSKFSVSVGYASERLAAYEAGRARLPYAVFKAISDRYRICPRWLAEGIGASQATTSFDDSKFIGDIRRNSLFTEVYDKYLVNQVRQRSASAEPRIEDYISRLQKLIEALLR